MASGKFLILRRPRSGRLDGHTGLIQLKKHFRLPLVGALGGWEALHLVGERMEMDRPVGEGHVPVLVLPRAGVFQPVLVIALLVILARMEIARAGLSPFGQVLVQFMMVWQR